MKVHKEKQGSAEWLALRAKCFTASEASAMMRCSPYQTRTQLLEQKSTGVAPEVSARTQRIFDLGHETEALAREILESELDEELYPVVGSVEIEGMTLLASLDGMDMLGETIFEHKLWNESKANSVRKGEAPEVDVWQLEQQLLVSAAEKVVYVVSDGTEEKLEVLEYRSDPERRKQLIAGWKQFEADLKDYEPSSPTTEAVGAAPDTLPSLRIEATGMVTASNLAEFKETASAVLSSINMELSSDQDFADAEKTVKWSKDVESRLDAAKQSVLAQTADIEEVFRVIDQIKAETRDKRLALDKAVKAQKESLKAQIIHKAQEALSDHIKTINKTLDSVSMPNLRADFAGAMKGKKKLDAMRSAVDDELASAKIEANQTADSIRLNLAIYNEHAHSYKFLFPDLQGLVLKPECDLVAIIKSRIIGHKEANAQAEAEKRPEPAPVEAADSVPERPPLPKEITITVALTVDEQSAVMAAGTGSIETLSDRDKRTLQDVVYKLKEGMRREKAA